MMTKAQTKTHLYEIEDLVREALWKLDELPDAKAQDDYDHILSKIKNLIIQLT